MTWSRVALVALSITLGTGCLFEEDPVQVNDDGAAEGGENGSVGEGSAGGEANGSNDLDAGSDEGPTGDDAGPGDEVQEQDASSANTDAGMELDAGATLDAGQDAGGDEDAATSADAGGDEPEPVVPDLGALDLERPDRAALIKSYLESEAYADNWFPAFEASTAARPLMTLAGNPPSTHGNQVRVFQNAVGKRAVDAYLAAARANPLVMPNGSVVVKEVYKAAVPPTDPVEYVLDRVLVMAKVAGLKDATPAFNHEGDWFFMSITGGTATAGSEACLNCHNGRSNGALWPEVPEVKDEQGNVVTPKRERGKADALVPYDRLMVAYCSDPANPECDLGH